jgi:hypothetical protein
MHLVNATINSAYLLARIVALGASLLLSSEAAAADIALDGGEPDAVAEPQDSSPLDYLPDRIVVTGSEGRT